MQDEKHTGRQHIEQRYAALREAGLKIDPSTAEVIWRYGYTLDPYGIEDLPEEYRQIGRVYFARAPDGDVWVCFEDLPEVAVEALWRRLEENPLASTPNVLSLNGLDRWEQAIIRITEEYPELYSDIDEEIKALDRMVDEVPDEACKARWRSGRPRLEKLNEVLKRKAAGLQLDS